MKQFYMDVRACFLPNLSYILVFGTDNPVLHFKKIDISINFAQELVRFCNFPIKKGRTEGAPA